MKNYICVILTTLCCLVGSFTAQAGNQPVYYPSSGNVPFSKAVKVGDTLYLSGLIGAGKAGLPKEFNAQITQLMDNLQSTLASFDLTTDAVFKCTVMIDDMDRWPDFNNIYIKYFKADRLPARSAFGADGLAMGAIAELECMAYMPGAQ
ncbi:RidA family protein [Alteromonas gilva]|uniref:RidA family protein n=1 Tax=Alteromonas gilva TaxID=2987522 RepID=A0ABT5L4D5_9ALTE|nr:RidA family protein [Alteromonas gilva]MDC8831905.1 RidA family protein [Alteromonas gilva]